MTHVDNSLEFLRVAATSRDQVSISLYAMILHLSNSGEYQPIKGSKTIIVRFGSGSEYVSGYPLQPKKVGDYSDTTIIWVTG